ANLGPGAFRAGESKGHGDGGTVDLLDVVAPVDDGRVEREVLPVPFGQRSVQVQRSVVGVDDLGLRVGAVQVGVAADELTRSRSRSTFRTHSRTRLDRGR